MNFDRKTVFASLIIGGTALGAGMLGLPVATAGGSFYQDLIVYLLCWIFNLLTGFLFVEALSYSKSGANIASMATTWLGRWGRFFAWALYLFLFYCLMISYVAAGGSLLAQFWGAPSAVSMVCFATIFALITLGGSRISSGINAILMTGLILSLLWFIVIGVGKIEFTKLASGSFSSSLIGIPVIFTSFAYQGTVPTMFSYLEQNTKKTKQAILWGTLIPFVAYILWDGIFKGTVPIGGESGLLAAKKMGYVATRTLSSAWAGSNVELAGIVFSFFAVTTSLVGVSLGLYDFLYDGIGVKRSVKNSIYLVGIVYFPPLIVALTNPGIFLTALGLAGGIGGSLLLGLMPIAIVTTGRYYYKRFKQQQMSGGSFVLALLTLFVVMEILITLYGKTVQV